MKKILTNNIGLKVVSLLAAIVLWMVIVNVDDPIIQKTYSGIQVEIINQDAIADENKTYEVTDGSDIISVTVTAERSVIENMSKDFIRATADLKQMSILNAAPIEIKSTRYSDRIKSLTSKTANVQVEIENRKENQLMIKVDTKGNISKGYVVGNISPNVDVVEVSGPESIVNEIKEARIVVNLDNMSESFTNSVPVKLYGSHDEVIEDDMLSVSQTEVLTKVEVLETKEIPVVAEASGMTASGFSATGTVVCDPSSVVIAGLGTDFDNLTSITIPSSEVGLDGASDNVILEVNIRKYLPKNIVLADSEDTGNITVIAIVEAHDTANVMLPYSSINVINVPDGYTATVLHETEAMEISISGLADNLSLVNTWIPTATIDASNLIAKPLEGQETSEEDAIFAGINEGRVILDLPDGIYQNEIPSININISREEEMSGEE